MSTCCPLIVFLVGCSSSVTNAPPEPDNSCKNIITYELSGDVHLQATHRYDEMGHLTNYIETNRDGQEIFQLLRTYDERGRRIEQIIDTTRFDSGHRKMTWEYDDSDRVIRSTYDGWSTNNAFRDTHLSYDAMGRRDTMNTAENGIPTDRVIYVYIDGDPSIVEEQHRNDPDQAIVYGFRYFLHQNRWLERLEIFDAETVKSAEWYTYENISKGMMSRRDFDSNADGMPEEIDSFTWNAANLLERAEYDIDGNSTLDQSNVYEYDSVGRITQRTWHVYDQGNLEFVTKFDWSDKTLKHVERVDTMTDQVIEAWSFTYGCSSEWPMSVNIAPIQGFRSELQTLPFSVDTSTWWKSFDSL